MVSSRRESSRHDGGSIHRATVAYDPVSRIRARALPLRCRPRHFDRV